MGRPKKNKEFNEKFEQYYGSYVVTSYLQCLTQLCQTEILLNKAYKIADNTEPTSEMLGNVVSLSDTVLKLRKFIEDSYFDLSLNESVAYPMGKDDYQALYNKQKGCCSICGRAMDKLYADHSHKTGEVRGLLCGTCNTGLGMFKGLPKNLNKAYDYLRKYNKKKKLLDEI